MGRQRERSLESAEEVLWPAVRILGLLFLTDAGSLEHPHHHFLLTPFRPGVESTLPSDSSFPKAPFRLPNMWRDVVVLSPLPLPLAIEKGAMVLLLPNAEHCDSASTRRAQVAANSSRARSDMALTWLGQLGSRMRECENCRMHPRGITSCMTWQNVFISGTSRTWHAHGTQARTSRSCQR